MQNRLPFSLLSKNMKINIYRTILLPVVCGCETSSLALVEERRLRVFGPEGEEVTGEWRRPHNEQLYDLYSSSNIIWVINSRRMRWKDLTAREGDRKGAYGVLMGIADEKRPLGKPRRNGRIILKWLFKKLDVGHGLD